MCSQINCGTWAFIKFIVCWSICRFILLSLIISDEGGNTRKHKIKDKSVRAAVAAFFCSAQQQQHKPRTIKSSFVWQILISSSSTTSTTTMKKSRAFYSFDFLLLLLLYLPLSPSRSFLLGFAAVRFFFLKKTLFIFISIYRLLRDCFAVNIRSRCALHTHSHLVRERSKLCSENEKHTYTDRKTETDI